MSHFTVLVIGDKPDEQLAPFHEFECTGENDQYVQDIDETDDIRAEYDNSTKSAYKLPDGRLIEQYDDSLYQPATPEQVKLIQADSRAISFKRSSGGSYGEPEKYEVRVIPEGAELVELPLSVFETLIEYVEGNYGYKVVPFGQQPDLEGEHKFGYALVDEKGELVKAVNRTNPNRKWDWYTVGGRWSNFFQLKPGVRKELACLPPGLTPRVERDGESLPATLSEAGSAPIMADQAYAGHIDFEAMRNEAARAAAERYDNVHAVIAQHPPIESWETVRDRHFEGVPEEGKDEAVKKARTEYHAQPGLKALRDGDLLDFFGNVEPYLVERDAYIRTATANRFSTFAVIKDGKWYEKGDMGWWGMVADEKGTDEWHQQFLKLIEDVKPDTLLTLVDCHI